MIEGVAVAAVAAWSVAASSVALLVLRLVDLLLVVGGASVSSAATGCSSSEFDSAEGPSKLALAVIVVGESKTLVPRLSNLKMVLQLEISVAEGMEMGVAPTAPYISTVTPCPQGPVPIRQKMLQSWRDRVLPNCFQLWVRTIEFFGPMKRI